MSKPITAQSLCNVADHINRSRDLQSIEKAEAYFDNYLTNQLLDKAQDGKYSYCAYLPDSYDKHVANALVSLLRSRGFHVIQDPPSSTTLMIYWKPKSI